jgi:membrane-associated phospholipid phosphatase
MATASARAEDAVLFWNAETNRAIQQTSMDPFMATRALALESVAILDTMRSAADRPGFLVRLPAPAGVSPMVATDAAAHTMLVYLFPARKAALDAAYVSSLAAYPADDARARAEAFGSAVVRAIIAIRDRDGWNRTDTVKVGNTPGQWRPTPPRFLPPLDPQWAALTPFALRFPTQFRPPAPPAPGTDAFNSARALTASIGDAHSRSRTPDQTQAAHYWSDGIGTYAPAGHWNTIAVDALRATTHDPMREAEVLAELNIAVADSAIAMADAKYTFTMWRPITAIREGDGAFPARPDWTPLLETPNHPSYLSGHSVFSGAAATVLTAEFGSMRFRAGSASTPGITRSFASFQQAAEEAANSRLWGGIHFKFDNDNGLTTGAAVGKWTLDVFQHPEAHRAPVIILDGAAMAGLALHADTPVQTVEVSLDGAPVVTVRVGADGRFPLPTCSKGRHAMTVTARDANGQIATASTTVNGG